MLRSTSRGAGLAGGERGEQVVLSGEDAARVGQQALAVRGQGDLPGGADEQLGAQLPLQPPYVPAERLLGDVPGGPRPG